MKRTLTLLRNSVADSSLSASLVGSLSKLLLVVVLAFAVTGVARAQLLDDTSSDDSETLYAAEAHAMLERFRTVAEDRFREIVTPLFTYANDPPADPTVDGGPRSSSPEFIDNYVNSWSRVFVGSAIQQLLGQPRTFDIVGRPREDSDQTMREAQHANAVSILEYDRVETGFNYFGENQLGRQHIGACSRLSATFANCRDAVQAAARQLDVAMDYRRADPDADPRVLALAFADLTDSSYPVLSYDADRRRYVEIGSQSRRVFYIPSVRTLHRGRGARVLGADTPDFEIAGNDMLNDMALNMFNRAQEDEMPGAGERDCVVMRGGALAECGLNQIANAQYTLEVERFLEDELGVENRYPGDDSDNPEERITEISQLLRWYGGWREARANVLRDEACEAGRAPSGGCVATRTAGLRDYGLTDEEVDALVGPELAEAIARGRRAAQEYIDRQQRGRSAQATALGYGELSADELNAILLSLGADVQVVAPETRARDDNGSEDAANALVGTAALAWLFNRAIQKTAYADKVLAYSVPTSDEAFKYGFEFTPRENIGIGFSVTERSFGEVSQQPFYELRAEFRF